MLRLSPLLLPQLGLNDDSCFDMNANGFQLYCVIYFILFYTSLCLFLLRSTIIHCLSDRKDKIKV